MARLKEELESRMKHISGKLLIGTQMCNQVLYALKNQGTGEVNINLFNQGNSGSGLIKDKVFLLMES